MDVEYPVVSLPPRPSFAHSGDWGGSGLTDPLKPKPHKCNEKSV
jgi:hypothetical protein